jgi:AcrR family transcriptional regulator
MHKSYRPHLSTAQDARAIRTRETLRRVMLELLESSSLSQISVGDIADASGMAYTTVTRHYPTKESLISDLAATEMRRLMDLSAPAYRSGETRAASLAFCRAVFDNRKLWSTLLASGAVPTLRDEYVRISLEVAAKQNAKAGPLMEIGLILMAGGTIELLAWWLQQKRPMSVEAIAEIYDELVVAPPTQASRRRNLKLAVTGAAKTAAAKPKKRKSKPL